MNQITAGESRVELPRQITPEPSIGKISKEAEQSKTTVLMVNM